MTPHPLLPAETDLTALKLELRRTAADLRRVARSLRTEACAAEVTAPAPEPEPQAALSLRFLRGGLWNRLRGRRS
jgi:hypothetical protein